MTGAEGATFVLRDGEFCYYADEDAIHPLWKGKKFPMKICISGWVMQNKQPVVISDIYQDERIPLEAYRPNFRKKPGDGAHSFGFAIGAIGNYWSFPYEVNADQIHLLQALADSTAVALENYSALCRFEKGETNNSNVLIRSCSG